jgi:hypothetical protein
MTLTPFAGWPVELGHLSVKLASLIRLGIRNFRFPSKASFVVGSTPPYFALHLTVFLLANITVLAVGGSRLAAPRATAAFDLSDLPLPLT